MAAMSMLTEPPEACIWASAAATGSPGMSRGTMKLSGRGDPDHQQQLDDAAADIAHRIRHARFPSTRPLRRPSPERDRPGSVLSTDLTSTRDRGYGPLAVRKGLQRLGGLVKPMVNRRRVDRMGVLHVGAAGPDPKAIDDRTRGRGPDRDDGPDRVAGRWRRTCPEVPRNKTFIFSPWGFPTGNQLLNPENWNVYNQGTPVQQPARDGPQGHLRGAVLHEPEHRRAHPLAGRELHLQRRRSTRSRSSCVTASPGATAPR